MTPTTAPDIADIVRQVIAELTAGSAAPAVARTAAAPAVPAATGGSFAGRHGVFASVDEAVAAAQEAFEQLERLGIEGRRKAIDHIRRISIEDAEELGRMEFEETRIGRLEHKIEKLRVLGQRSPGVEFMQSEVFSGDHGL
ncbi:MAG: aldehyde dehydrogenase EutE, partial [Planctomycetia bacterium]